MAVAEKRPLNDSVFSTKHILMDIEGTTTSISFVKDTLFPYVRKNLDEYLQSHWSEEEFKNVLSLLKEQAAEDKKAEVAGVVEIPLEGSDDDIKAATVKNILWQMDADRKTTGLKKLQGQMWRDGYKNGELKGHLYSDVVPALREWIKDGRKLYVYSSGSVEAQKLLFGHSIEGDLTELFTDFFDTQVGAKVESGSYKAIVTKLDCNADDVLFLTDLPKEATAAREAGLPVLLVEREGNEPLASDLRKEFSAVSSFDQVSFDTVSKKHKAEEETNGETENKKQKLDEDAKQESTEEVKEETKPAEGDAAPMDVDPVEPAVAGDSESKDSESKTEAMDVDKPSEETKVEETVKESVEPQVIVEKQEDLPVQKSETKEENAAKTEVAVPCEENGSTEESKTKQDSEETKAVEVDKESKSEESKEVTTNGDASERSEKANPGTEETEKPVEQESVIEKEAVKEAEVPQEKTEDQNVEKMETDCENKLPKEDSKTEAKEDKPDVVEEPTVISEPVKDKVEKSEEVKVEDEKTVTEEKKDAVAEVSEGKVENEEKVESTDVKTVSETETSPETENKSDKAEEKEENVVSKESNGEANGNANGEANGNTNGEANGESKVENGEKEKLNGSANGKDAETNGKVSNGASNGDSNGHSKEKDVIPEVIVTKNAAQIENGSGDAGVVVEA